MKLKHPDSFYAETALDIGRELADRQQRPTSNGNGHRRKTPTAAQGVSYRTITLTKASSIRVRPVRWLWQERIALGALTLVGGREGIGKSLTVYTLGAQVTRGQLPGVFFGIPRAIIVAATEDSWSHTIVPRLMAAGADLDLVYRVDVVTADIVETAISLPRDLPGLEQRIGEVQAALVILDPLLSRLDAALDSHKDQQVRLALEPLVSLAERTSTTIAGLIHVNKSASDDPLTTLMASRAFAAVARSVLFVMSDPDHEGTRLLGMAKNNLGRMDLPTLSFTIAGVVVAETDEGPVWTGKLEWTGESDRTIRDALQAVAEVAGCNRTAVGEAADWLQDYLASQDGSADSADVKREGIKAGHTKDALHRARLKLKIESISVGFPRRTAWKITVVGPQSSDSLGESATTQTTQTTATTGRQSFESSELSESSERHETLKTTGAFRFNPAEAFLPGWKRGGA